MKPPNHSTTVRGDGIKRVLFQGSRRVRARAARKAANGGGAARLVFAALITALFLSIPLLDNMFGRDSQVNASTETIGTFACNCATVKTTFTLGERAWATVDGAIDNRRIIWVAPDGSIAQVSNSFFGTGGDAYDIPTGSDPFAQVGTWSVRAISSNGAGYAVAEFLVLDPNSATNADLSITMFAPSQAAAGTNIFYRIEIANGGPNAAQNVTLTHPTPFREEIVGDQLQPVTAATFVSETQDAGPEATCTNTGSVVCTIPSLPSGEIAVFTLTYNVNTGIAIGDKIINTATVSSSTTELYQPNNTTRQETGVTGTPATPPCTILCPGDITRDNDPDLCSAVVTYTTPSTTGQCLDPDTGTTPTVVCSPPSGSAFPVGVNEVTCAAGPTACSFNVTVHDTRAAVQPTISCPGDITTGEEFEGAGSAPVTFAPTTTGNCVQVVCEPPSGFNFAVGTTEVTCKATDSSGVSVTCSFDVTVTSGSGCTFSCPGDVTQSSGTNCSAAVTYQDPSASTTCGTVTCKDQNNVTRHSGDTFPAGTTFVTCTSNQGPSCTFTVTVTETVPPTIVTCASNKSVPANADCEGVIPNLLPEVVATDNCSAVTKTQSPAAGSVVPSGNVLVTITVEDSSGNTATCTATVRVDNAAPVITCPANVSSTLPPNTTATSKVVTYAAATATDNCSTPTVACVPPSGSTFPVGPTTVTCTATDGVGNTNSCSFTVTVLYVFTGFFSPVDNPPVINTVNAGKAIPVKFGLSGNKGLSIFAVDHPASVQIACDSNAPLGEIEETVTAGNSSLQYDAASDRYIYVWKTESSWAGTCRKLIVKLNDGSEHIAYFKFR